MTEQKRNLLLSIIEVADIAVSIDPVAAMLLLSTVAVIEHGLTNQGLLLLYHLSSKSTTDSSIRERASAVLDRIENEWPDLIAENHRL